MLICILGAASVSLTGYAKENVYQKKDSKKKQEFKTEWTGRLPDAGAHPANITEVSDLESLCAAVAETESGIKPQCREQEGTDGVWQNKRLLVKSETDFDTMGADRVIYGYDEMYILEYDTQEHTKAAFETLKNAPDLTVEPDYVYEKTAEGTGALEETPAVKQPGASVITPGKEREVCVAVLDSGYDGSFGDARIVQGTDITASGTVQDQNGHGTAVANLILNYTPEYVKIMPVKIADEGGRSSALKLYLGICRAIEQGADIINISMSANQASNPETIGAAIRRARQAGIFTVVSAGNEGKDASCFSPSDIKEAIVVSAVGADKNRAEYSNYGAGIDYCSYGEMGVLGRDKKEVTMSGTSVSAALVSAVIAEYLSCNTDTSYESVISALDRDALDLGMSGKDDYYGRGFAAPKGIKPAEAEKEVIELPELLTCDWRRISDRRLNELIGDSDERIVRRFLDLKSEEERQEILKRADILGNEHVEIVCGADGTERYRSVDTLYKYLYSERFDAYDAQKKISGTYYMYIQNADRKAYLYTNQDGTKCTLHVKFSGTKTNPADNPTITVSGTNAGAVSLSGAKIDSVKTFTDDNGNANTIGQVGVVGIAVKKRAHSRVTGQKKTHELKNNHGSDLWSGGFTGFGSNACEAVESAGLKLMVGIGDLELNKENKVQSYQINLTNYPASDWGSVDGWTVTQNPSCFQAGSKRQTHIKSCTNCHKTTDTKAVTQAIPQLSHSFAGAAYLYGTNHNILNGERWLQCGYACKDAGGSGYDRNGAWWRTGYEYLQQIWYRFMGTDGQYPADYTAFINGYYPANALVPGWSYEKSAESEFLPASGTGSYLVTDQANITYVNVARKAYRIVYNGNGADFGSVDPQSAYCGQVLDLRKNRFARQGAEFLGWSKTPDGEIIKSSGVKNLSLTDGAVVTLYAKWKLLPYKITLDNQGANKSGGTRAVYECFSKGYYKNKEMTQVFAKGRIQVPEKEREDPTLPEGVRKQQFLGYYTKKNGKGHMAADRDGFLQADINGAGDYRYFTEDAVVYADWADMCAVRFDANLTEEDEKILSEGESHKSNDGLALCPFTRFAAAGEDITVSFGEAVIQNETFRDIYRFRGWSLTPKIKDESELILSKEILACTFTMEKDVTLYAQWDCSFVIACMGNGQTEGADYLQEVSSVTDEFTFCQNGEGQEECFFRKETQKPAMDIATGQMTNEAGQPYMERVPYRFLGFSLEKEKGSQENREIYWDKNTRMQGGEMIINAKEKILFGAAPSDFNAGTQTSVSQEGLIRDNTPVIPVYAVWDEYPQIFAADIYVPLSDAQNGVLSKTYLLDAAKAVDEELKSKTNPSGAFESEEDTKKKTLFTIADYQPSDFTGAEQEMSLTVTYRAKDGVDNMTEKMVRVYLVDTSGKDDDSGTVRFISEQHADTLDRDSVWRDGAYADTLARALGNKKTGEEYTSVTPVQKAFGIKPVLKPGSGVWDHVQQIWEFTHDEVLCIQDYVEISGPEGEPAEFLEKFGYCRVR